MQVLVNPFTASSEALKAISDLDRNCTNCLYCYLFEKNATCVHDKLFIIIMIVLFNHYHHAGVDLENVQYLISYQLKQNHSSPNNEMHTYGDIEIHCLMKVWHTR